MGNTNAGYFRPVWHRRPWSWLFSLRTGIVVLALTAVASMVGTAIDPLERAQALVYHSVWYRALLLLLASNLACATVRNIFDKILPFRQARFQSSPGFYEAVAPSWTMPFGGSAEEAAAAFRRHGFRAATSGPLGYAWRGKLSRWGSAIAHTGIVIVLAGGFASTWVAREGEVRLAEGEQADTMVLRTDPPRRAPLGFTLRCDDFETGFFPKTNIPSKYISTVAVLEDGVELQTARVEVNRSLTTHGWALHQTSYEEIPGEQRYVVSVLPPGSSTPAAVEISPGQKRVLPGFGGIELALGAEPNPEWTVLLEGKVATRGRFSVGARPLKLRVERFEPDFVMGPGREVSSRSENLNNPAMQIALYEGEKKVFEQWLFGREDLKAMMHGSGGRYDFELTGVSGQAPRYQFHIVDRGKDRLSSGTLSLGLGEEAVLGAPAAPAPETAPASMAAAAGTEIENALWKVRLVKTAPAYFTVLTLTRNPAVPVIYVGCGVIMLGLLVAFFIRRKEIWFWADGRNKVLRVAAAYRHPQTSLDRATLRALGAIDVQTENAE